MTDTEFLSAADGLARTRLSDKRYNHTLRVADTAAHLAELHSLDAGKARLAALLHDAAREVGQPELLRIAEKSGIPVDDFERDRPILLHGPVAAVLATEGLGVEDGAVLEAVRVHTTGEPGMGPLALALYVADKIEPARDYPSVGELRKLAGESLHRATLASLRRTHAHNRDRDRPTHPESRKTLKWLEGSVDAAERSAEGGIQ